MRVGTGYDVHRLAPGHRLVLGGVEVPFDCGLIGWSDADVLIAANLGDIGQLFPPGDPKYKGISSLVLLGRVGKKLADKGYTIGNIDSVIIAEQPLLRDLIPKMCNISQALGIDTIDVSVKANTSEELGFVGREEGMAASAVALVNGK
jgi:2-C-methyl-D-erythritol 2,4-cyclodiphosphate synthase